MNNEIKFLVFPNYNPNYPNNYIEQPQIALVNRLAAPRFGYLGAATGLVLGVGSYALSRYKIESVNDFRDACNSLMRELQKFDPVEGKKIIEHTIQYLRENGIDTPDDVNPDAILEAACPYKEFMKQYYRAFSTEPSLLKSFTSTVFQLGFGGIAGPVCEEYLFREIIQTKLLVEGPKNLLNKISPRHTHLIDTKVYTILRILIVSLMFSYVHNTNKGSMFFTDDYVAQQVKDTFYLGLFFGVLRECDSLSAAMTAHITFNVLALLPGFFKTC